MKPYILQTINFSTERSSWVPPRHDTRRQFAIWVMQARLGMNHGWWVMGGRPDETVWFSTLRPYRCFPGGMKVLPGIEVFLTMNLFYAQKKGKHVQCTSTIKSYKIIWGKPSHTSLGCLGVHVLSNVALVFLVGMICILPCFHPWHQKLVWMRTFCEIWIKNVLLFCFFECLPCSIRKRVSFAWFLQVMRGRWLLLGLFQPLQQLHWTTVEAKKRCNSE